MQCSLEGKEEHQAGPHLLGVEHASTRPHWLVLSESARQTACHMSFTFNDAQHNTQSGLDEVKNEIMSLKLHVTSASSLICSAPEVQNACRKPA